ncbi:hypothetical protein DFH11DRAFT_1526592, partial [Phellopilus nigrolimitatus]
IDVLLSTSISNDTTCDVIDWGAECVVREDQIRVKNLKTEGRVVNRFSAIGYSMGGLVRRYLVGCVI